LGKLIRDAWVKRRVYGGEKGKSGYWWPDFFVGGGKMMSV
jgi:hypothetical protein